MFTLLYLFGFCFFFFFFKQKTAYEMRISDWSSDVCSSDLFTNTILTSFSLSDRPEGKHRCYWWVQEAKNRHGHAKDNADRRRAGGCHRRCLDRKSVV